MLPEMAEKRVSGKRLGGNAGTSDLSWPGNATLNSKQTRHETHESSQESGGASRFC